MIPVVGYHQAPIFIIYQEEVNPTNVGELVPPSREVTPLTLEVSLTPEYPSHVECGQLVDEKPLLQVVNEE